MSPLVHLVDDDPDVLDAHRLILQLSGFQVATYENPETFLDRMDSRPVGCVVMDLRMPGMSGLVCMEKLRSKGVDLPILFVTGHGDMETAVHALKHGAADFIAKPVSAERLREACQKLTDWHVADRERRREQETIHSKLASLTAREREVAELVAQGLTNKVIADDLGISEQAVKFHRMNICGKLQVRSAVEIARLIDVARPTNEDEGLKTVTVLE